MQRCKTCKHWDPLAVGERDQVYRDAYAPNHYCRLLSNGSNEGDTLGDDNDLLPAAKGIGGVAVTTGPEFGCVHYHLKEQ